MYSFIELLRALATALITNSHFDGVYPWDISWGGCPGVALFFTISGFLLVKSVEYDYFFLWWIRKVIRLYIPLTIVNLITTAIGFRKLSISLFLFPVNIDLWYVPILSILYIPYYYVVRMDKRRVSRPKLIEGGYRGVSILIAISIYIVMYLVMYRDEFFVEPEIMFRALYGFTGMMIGSLTYNRRISICESKKGLLFLGSSIICCCGFLGIKLLMNRVGIVMKLQFMTQVFSVGFATFALFTGLCYEEKIKYFMKSIPGKIIGIISMCSLEVYLVQFPIIDYFRHVAFPANLILIIVTTILTAWIVHIVSNRLYKTLDPLLRFEV